MDNIYKNWYSRGYVPHFDSPEVVQFITFRLADSLPHEALIKLEEEVKLTGDINKLEYLQEYLDRGYGSCSLKIPEIAILVQDALLFFDNERYKLISWVIMPNHVHLLIEINAGYSMPKVIQSWKGFTARKANQLLGSSGHFWQRDYFDRYIRNEEHYYNTIDYIHDNPVKAGLVEIA